MNHLWGHVLRMSRFGVGSKSPPSYRTCSACLAGNAVLYSPLGRLCRSVTDQYVVRCKWGGGKSPLAQPIRYALNRIPKALPYLDTGVLEFDNDTAERAVKPVTLGRKNCVFAGSLRAGKAMAIAFTLIETAKLNGVDL
jgi:hypothetical protein